jgi:hypothetical protein
MYPYTWHLEKADGIQNWLHVCRSLRHCNSWIGNTRWHRRRTSIWRTRAKVARSALTRVRKCKSRTSTTEFETYLSVIAMQRRRSDNQNGRFEMEKIRKLYLNKSQSSCPSEMAK